jgi:Cellulose binding domain
MPPPTPTPTSAAVITTVTYSMPQRWDDGFQGQLTIVNNTSSPVSDWQITIVLPGDRVDTVWNADWQPTQGGSVIMTAASYDQVIEPGASQSVNFTAQGNATSPTSCTFDGSACQSAAAGGPASAP